ncbi:unnamed protein product [Trifolium pratense]|uniref:Uncharacterized protein n=1 Tax=Trifolium pratense TaxID=57577 RepID=A0ACB0I9G0_TRIPR|nr:unnamed protein product [Trifolium pratense]
MTKNMPQILMFVYALIILLSLILVATYNIDVPCKTDEDCPEASPPRIVKCINSICDDISGIPF